MTKTCACGQEIEFEAESARESCCPNCGSAILPEGQKLLPARTAREEDWRDLQRKEERAKIVRGMMGVGAGFCALLCFGLILSGIGSEAEKQRQQKREYAELYQIVTNAVTQRLKAPRTAVFDGLESFKLKGDRAERTVEGYVDSQNGFGAMVRTAFEVKMIGDQVSNVSFPGQE